MTPKARAALVLALWATGASSTSLRTNNNEATTGALPAVTALAIAKSRAKPQLKLALLGQHHHGRKDSMDAEQQVTELDEVATDLEASVDKDDSTLAKMNKQIVDLVHERDALRQDKARKGREVSFLHREESTIQNELTGHLSARSADSTIKELGQEVATSGSDKELAEADVAAADADKGLASLASSVGASKAGLVVSSSIVSGAASDKAAQATADRLQAEAEKAAAAQAAADKAAQAAADRAAQATAEKAAAAQAAADKAAKAAAESNESAETKQLKAQLKAMKDKEQAELQQQLAEERAKEAKRAEERKRIADEAQAKADAEEKARTQAEQEEKQKKEKAEALANSADDSFKDFMKEEDGENDQGDPAYEDSANALAGAIGWDRGAVEHNADAGIKQLTEAIGGKKVIQSLQGMMAGVSR